MTKFCETIFDCTYILDYLESFILGPTKVKTIIISGKVKEIRITWNRHGEEYYLSF
jgi:hypothetical protein